MLLREQDSVFEFFIQLILQHWQLFSISFESQRGLVKLLFLELLRGCVHFQLLLNSALQFLSTLVFDLQSHIVRHMLLGVPVDLVSLLLSSLFNYFHYVVGVAIESQLQGQSWSR